MKNYSVAALYFIVLLSSPAFAQKIFYKFDLKPQEMIENECDVNQVLTPSRVKVGVDLNRQATPVLTDIVLRLCVKGYGFQKIGLPLRLPRDFFNQDVLLSLNPQQSRRFEAQKVLLTRLADQKDRAVFDLKLDEWPVGNSLSQMRVQFTIELDPAKQLIVKKKTGGRFFWSGLRINFKHRFVSSPFVLIGELDKIERSE